MGLIRRAVATIGRSGESRLERAPDPGPRRFGTAREGAKRKRRILGGIARPDANDRALARVQIPRAFTRARHLYDKAMRAPLDSNCRRRNLAEARALVKMASAAAVQNGLGREIAQAEGIQALRARLLEEKPVPPRPQKSRKRGGKSTSVLKRRARGWGDPPRPSVDEQLDRVSRAIP